jgi:hypothetical protein
MRFRNTLLALLVFGALAAFIYFYEYKGETAREEQERAGKSALVFKREDLSQIEIARPDAEPVVVKKESGIWTLQRPLVTRADPDRVDSLVSSIEFLRVEETLADATPEEKKQFQLDPAAVTVTLTGQGQEPGAAPATQVLRVGDKAPLGSNRYAARGDAAEVLLVSGGLDSLLSADAASLRYKKVVGIDTWKVARFRVETPAGRVALAHAANHWTLEEPGPFPAEEGKVQSLWLDLQGAEAQAFETEAPSPSDLERFGLTRPAATLTVEEKDAAAPVRVAFGDPDPNGPVYARRSDLEAVMRVERKVLDALRGAAADPSGLRDARVAPVDRFKLATIEIRRPGAGAVTLHKDDVSRWHWGTPEGAEVPSEQVNALLDAAENAKASGFLEGASGAPVDAVLTLALTEKSDEDARTVTVSLLPESGTAGAPRRFSTSVSTSVYLVSPELAATLLQAASALKEPAAEPAAQPEAAPQ